MTRESAHRVQGHPLIQSPDWQEALHCLEERRESEDAATGVYMGVMYTEYLDAILAPQVCTHPLLSMYSQTDALY